MFILNLFVWAQASSTALPFGTLIGLLALWLFIQLPLVYVGNWYGFHRSQPYEQPTKTNSIPRQIPQQSWYTKSMYSVLLAGLVPFAVIFIELLFVFRSMWQDKSGYYYVFGFLSVVSLVCIVTVVEVTIVATYIQLCAEVGLFSNLTMPSLKKANAKTELPLVVAVHFHRRRLCLLGLPLLRVVLLHQTAHPGFYLRPSLLLLQPPGEYRLRLTHRHRGLFDRVCVCETDLWVSLTVPRFIRSVPCINCGVLLM